MNFGGIQIPEEHVICKTQKSYVFVNIRPFLPFHILVSPIRCVSRIYELTDCEVSDLFRLVKRCTEKLSLISSSYTINIQDGVDAGQKVEHVHVHIVPRNRKDLIDNEAIYKEGALDCVRSDRSHKEMEDECIYLRGMFK